MWLMRTTKRSAPLPRGRGSFTMDAAFAQKLVAGLDAELARRRAGIAPGGRSVPAGGRSGSPPTLASSLARAMYERAEEELWRRAWAVEDDGRAILTLCLSRIEEALEADEFEYGVEDELKALHDQCIDLLDQLDAMKRHERDVAEGVEYRTVAPMVRQAPKTASPPSKPSL